LTSSPLAPTNGSSEAPNKPISRHLLNHPISQSPFLLHRVRKLTAPLASVAVNPLLPGPQKSKEIYFSVCARLVNA
jgi:hypothetical protein